MAGDFNKITREDIDVFKEVTSATCSHVNALDEYQRLATKTAHYPGVGSMLGLSYVTHKLTGESGEFAEHFGKSMRDDGSMNGLYMDGGAVQNDGIGLTPERKTALLKEAGDVLWYLSAIGNELGYTLSYIALSNLEKLCDRTERGKLSGSGDNR